MMTLLESSDRLKDLRRQAAERFEALPWPAKTDEEWRRTDPAEIPLAQMPPATPAPALRVECEPPPPEGSREGLILTDLATAFRQWPELVEETLFAAGMPEGLAKFTALHQALWQGGLFCCVPEGLRVERPLRSRMAIAGGEGAAFPHTLIVAGRGADLTLIDERISEGNGGGPVVSDEMVEILVRPGATLRYIHLQRWGPAVRGLFAQRAVVEKEGRFLNVMVGLGSRLTKGTVETVLAGPGARSDLLGILFGSGNQHFDFHTLQDHRAERTASDLLYKSALKDASSAIYTGLIRIRKEAQRSDAYQANRSILLSEGAKADSVPMLEIEADDVRCTHGVAVGPVDEEQTFYLMSRGLAEAEAQRLVVEGFFEQVLRRIPVEEVKERLMQEVTNRMEGD